MTKGEISHTPWHYAAYTRHRKALAKAEQSLMDGLIKHIDNPNVEALDCGFLIHAVRLRERVCVTDNKDASFVAFRGLAEYAPHAPRPDESPHEEIKNEDERMFINGWVARRLYKGREQTRIVRVEVINPKDSKSEWRTKAFVEPWSDRNRDALVMTLNTFRSGMYVYGFAEEQALRKLRSLIFPDEYERYLITGALSFEGASGVHYLIRKARPTLAYRHVDYDFDTNSKVVVALAALCTHPLGYFDGTWMGTMPLTDEVIAHLLMLRHSEHFFWRKCNQHSFDRVEIGL